MCACVCVLGICVLVQPDHAFSPLLLYTCGLCFLKHNRQGLMSLFSCSSLTPLCRQPWPLKRECHRVETAYQFILYRPSNRRSYRLKKVSQIVGKCWAHALFFMTHGADKHIRVTSRKEPCLYTSDSQMRSASEAASEKSWVGVAQA